MAIPKQATASALILTGIAMLASIRHLQGDEPTDILPALAMVLMTLISNSFGTGIAAGILVHVAVQILAGRIRTLSIGLIVLAVPLGFFFYSAATRH
jgi:AGZA family xanthine/uracil permease-like MFS transporter